eukprot:symbB.v1.2.004180.t1/scaffold233.1/size288367/11
MQRFALKNLAWGLIERMDRLSRPNVSQAVAQEHHQLRVLGDFYYYYGSSTSPDCHEMNKWFLFDHAFSMSMDQFQTFKAMFPSPGNNRPLQHLRSHQVVKNSFEDSEPNHFDFYLSRHAARNRFFAGEFFILVPISATLLLMFAIMSAILVRDWVATKKSFSSMAEMIGKSAGNRV